MDLSDHSRRDAGGSAQQQHQAPLQQPQQVVHELNANDVLIGRGAPSIDNEGNIRFRELVQLRKKEYSATNKRTRKDIIARKIVQTIQHRGGRFLGKIDAAAESSLSLSSSLLSSSSTRKAWATVHEDYILNKVKQALRGKSKADQQESPPLQPHAVFDKMDPTSSIHNRNAVSSNNNNNNNNHALGNANNRMLLLPQPHHAPLNPPPPPPPHANHGHAPPLPPLPPQGGRLHDMLQSEMQQNEQRRRLREEAMHSDNHNNHDDLHQQQQQQPSNSNAAAAASAAAAAASVGNHPSVLLRRALLPTSSSNSRGGSFPSSSSLPASPFHHTPALTSLDDPSWWHLLQQQQQQQQHGPPAMPPLFLLPPHAHSNDPAMIHHALAQARASRHAAASLYLQQQQHAHAQHPPRSFLSQSLERGGLEATALSGLAAASARGVPRPHSLHEALLRGKHSGSGMDPHQQQQQQQQQQPAASVATTAQSYHHSLHPPLLLSGPPPPPPLSRLLLHPDQASAGLRAASLARQSLARPFPSSWGATTMPIPTAATTTTTTTRTAEPTTTTQPTMLETHADAALREGMEQRTTTTASRSLCLEATPLDYLSLQVLCGKGLPSNDPRHVAGKKEDDAKTNPTEAESLPPTLIKTDFTWADFGDELTRQSKSASSAMSSLGQQAPTDTCPHDVFRRMVAMHVADASSLASKTVSLLQRLDEFALSAPPLATEEALIVAWWRAQVATMTATTTTQQQEKETKQARSTQSSGPTTTPIRSSSPLCLLTPQACQTCVLQIAMLTRLTFLVHKYGTDWITILASSSAVSSHQLEKDQASPAGWNAGADAALVQLVCTHGYAGLQHGRFANAPRCQMQARIHQLTVVLNQHDDDDDDDEKEPRVSDPLGAGLPRSAKRPAPSPQDSEEANLLLQVAFLQTSAGKQAVEEGSHSNTSSRRTSSSSLEQQAQKKQRRFAGEADGPSDELRAQV